MTLSSLPGLDCEDNNNEIPYHAYQTFQEIDDAGPPAQPLDFPTPTINRSCSICARAMDHRHGKIYNVHLLCRSSIKDRKVAYLFKKKIARTVYGSVRLYVVLRRRLHRYDCGGVEEADWISTDEVVAIKASSWSKMRQLRGRHLEDPLKEAACMQLVGNYHANVLGSFETLQDDSYLYVVMPYCSGGTLLTSVSQDRQSRNNNAKTCHKTQHGSNKHSSSASSSSASSSSSKHHYHHIDEPRARVWFRQLLQALLHLQRKGVRHGDLSLDNVVLEDDQLVIIDFGLSLRVPYVDPSNFGGVSDVSEGTSRRLIRPQGQSGSLTYLDPVIIEGQEAFDGFFSDLFSAGVILFTMLVGRAPFQWPSTTDVCYKQINKGRLKELMKANSHSMSREACDLLQKMMWRDPRKRLTLAEVLEHPWVVGPPDDSSAMAEEREPKAASQAFPAACQIIQNGHIKEDSFTSQQFSI